MKRSRFSLGGLLLVLVGCGGSVDSLRARAAFDLGCPENDIRIKELNSGNMVGDGQTVGVVGCGERAVYIYHATSSVGGTWVLNSDSSGGREETTTN